MLVVQQLEGNVLQPIIQGRGFNLHAAVVILAVTAGSSLAGIIGAFLAVPLTALIAVVYRYVRDELDDKSPEVADDGTRTRLADEEDGEGTRLVKEEVAPPRTDAEDVADRPRGVEPASPGARSGRTGNAGGTPGADLRGQT